MHNSPRIPRISKNEFLILTALFTAMMISIGELGQYGLNLHNGINEQLLAINEQPLPSHSFIRHSSNINRFTFFASNLRATRTFIQAWSHLSMSERLSLATILASSLYVYSMGIVGDAIMGNHQEMRSNYVNGLCTLFAVNAVGYYAASAIEDYAKPSTQKRK